MKVLSICLFVPMLIGCAAPLKTSVAPFKPPDQISNAQRIWDLVIAVEVLDSPSESEKVFGTDLYQAEILPVQLVVHNVGGYEYEIDSSQIFGFSEGEFYPAFTLNQAAKHVRESSIGTTVVTNAVVGAAATAAAGAAIGAAAGQAAGDAGSGAASGAAIGGAVGASAGAAGGASDSYTHQFRHELASQDFGNRVIFGGDLQQGFIYFQFQPYSMLRVKVTNISQRETKTIEIPLQVQKRIEETSPITHKTQ